jgi:hypothetical protein
MVNLGWRYQEASMRTKTTLAVLACALLPFGAMGQDVVADAVAACQPDIETFCSQVTPGEGRLLACFVAHEDKISGACNWALYQALQEFDAFATAIAYVASSCRDDLLEFCGEVRVGEGRVATCLLEHVAEVSETCKKAMDDVELQVSDE